jgi:hypothetical protein
MGRTNRCTPEPRDGLWPRSRPSDWPVPTDNRSHECKRVIAPRTGHSAWSCHLPDQLTGFTQEMIALVVSEKLRAHLIGVIKKIAGNRHLP